MLLESCFGCKLFDVPDLDCFVMRASGKDLVFGVNGQRFDRVRVGIVDVLHWVDLVDHELMLLFNDVMFGLHTCYKIFKEYDNLSSKVSSISR